MYHIPIPRKLRYFHLCKGVHTPLWLKNSEGESDQETSSGLSAWLWRAIMLIGMMVVSASAAGFDDFSDKDEIVNKDAVSMLTILGVINRGEDGSFGPRAM